MASAKRDCLDSYPTCTVSNQESDRTADGTQPRMLAQSLKHAFKTRTPTGAASDRYPTVKTVTEQPRKHALKTHLTPVPQLWLARSAITLTVTLLAWSESDRTADGAQCWSNH